MWVFASAQEAVYAIQPGRGFEQATEVLGQNFPGFLVRDGWSIYRQFVHAFHQTCLAHLLRRCREMIQVRGTRAQFPARIQVILQAALALRDRRQHRHISAHGLEVARGSWRRAWIARCIVARALRTIAAWRIICCANETRSSPFCIVLD
jgi:Transposase IS66 family